MTSPLFPPPRVEEMKDLPLAIKCSDIVYYDVVNKRTAASYTYPKQDAIQVHIAYVTILFTPRDIWLT